MNSFHSIFVRLLLLAIPLWACEPDPESTDQRTKIPAGAKVTSGGDGTAQSGTDPSGTKADGKQGTTDGLKALAFTDTEAMDWVDRECANCHNAEGEYFSFWPMPDKVTPVWIETDVFRLQTYQSIYNYVRQKAGVGQPAAMPTKAPNEDEVEAGKKMLAWYKKKLPLIVHESDMFYGNEKSLNGGVILNFQCKNPDTGRSFIRKLFNDALGREPSREEIAQLKDPEQVLTKEERIKLVDATLSGTHKETFKAHGLKKFARKFSGADEIVTDQAFGLTPAVVADLKEEFYQSLLANLDTNFHDFLMADKVMVTAQTAPLYGCEASMSENEWFECTMKAPRETFFSTIGFLSSKRQSFLVPSNNYGRMGVVLYTANGESFKAATNGAKGEKVNPLPSCLKTKDRRGFLTDNNLAPYGSAQVPATGNVCQSCHVARGLAAGSIVFRKFSHVGELLSPEQITSVDEKYGEMVAEAIATGNVVVGADGFYENTNEEFLKSLLDEKAEQACIPLAGKDGSDLVLKGVKDLATYALGDKGANLSRGLGKHIPKALSNLPVTTQEIISSSMDAWTKSNGKVIDVITEYFKTETYACKSVMNK